MLFVSIRANSFKNNWNFNLKLGMHHVPPHPHGNPLSIPQLDGCFGTIDRSVEKNRTQLFCNWNPMALTWRHLMFFIYWTHDEWHEFSLDFCHFSKKGEFCAWYMKFLCGGKSPMEQYLCLASRRLVVCLERISVGRRSQVRFWIYMILNKHDKQIGSAIANLYLYRDLLIWHLEDPWRLYIHTIYTLFMLQKITLLLRVAVQIRLTTPIGPVTADTSGGWPEKKCRIFFRRTAASLALKPHTFDGRTSSTLENW